MSAQDIAERYRSQSLQYLENAAHSLRAGEAAKAGEFLWGSLAEAFKAVAASKGILLRAHWDITKYARTVAREFGDEAIYAVYIEASHLHSNFYEAELKVDDIVPLVDRVREAVQKVLGLLPETESA